MTLKDSMPYEFVGCEFDTTRAYKMKDVEVVSEHLCNWIGKEKHVFHWVKLANGYAVGFNENPARGWSFPVKKIS
jgi:hypothetical protein